MIDPQKMKFQKSVKYEVPYFFIYLNSIKPYIAQPIKIIILTAT